MQKKPVDDFSRKRVRNKINASPVCLPESEVVLLVNPHVEELSLQERSRW